MYLKLDRKAKAVQIKCTCSLTHTSIIHLFIQTAQSNENKQGNQSYLNMEFSIEPSGQQGMLFILLMTTKSCEEVKRGMFTSPLNLFNC